MLDRTPTKTSSDASSYRAPLILVLTSLVFAVTAALAGDALASATLPVSPVFLNASSAYNGLQVEPRSITYTGDGTGLLGGANPRDHGPGIDWMSWTADIALGTGFNQLDNCSPSCAEGKFSGYPVKIELWRARTLAGTLVFTRMTIFYRTGARGGLPSTTRSPTSIPVPAEAMAGGRPAK
jgi:hypothetical protein